MSEAVNLGVQSPFGTLLRDAKTKLANDNDIKIIVQGANSQTGIGKTTFAIKLCRAIDSTTEEWKAEDKAFVDVQEYLNAHLEYPGGSALLLDEIEAGADRRRANSHENVNLSQGWATLRARNIATVCTLPSISMLDSRLLELADYWVLVKERGLAQPFRINVNDFAPGRTPQRKALPGDEHIQFDDLPSDDPDKAYLDDIKDDMVKDNSMKSIRWPQHKEKLKEAKKEAAHEKRNEIIRGMYGSLEVSYSDIGNMDSIDLTRQTVGQIVRDSDE